MSSAKQKVERYCAEHDVDFQDNTGEMAIELNCWSPPGKVWKATGAHSLVMVSYTDKTWAWGELWKDMRQGFYDDQCTPDCEGCQ